MVFTIFGFYRSGRFFRNIVIVMSVTGVCVCVCASQEGLEVCYGCLSIIFGTINYIKYGYMLEYPRRLATHRSSLSEMPSVMTHHISIKWDPIQFHSTSRELYRFQEAFIHCANNAHNTHHAPIMLRHNDVPQTYICLLLPKDPISEHCHALELFVENESNATATGFRCCFHPLII